ncbi:tRNA (cytidine(34)-2'-O)-methyltransferase [Pelagibacteraceae bacterium]|nr:tRNA (cytidine(34)-2'-O)-methyltransferase [Pelagibacteraceae bacterium]
MISIALYKPDIPQNTASMLRLCACFGLKMHIIEPCGFNLNDSRFKRVIMDYINQSSIIRYENFNELLNKNKKSRIILMSTKAKRSLFKFKFKNNDIILLGRESKGVPEYIHKRLKNRLKIPISSTTRSLNVAVSASISTAEALRQTKKF